jgi:glyoxylase-like metal-dependent hydrolase (beta-lactamase superfamily II)
MAELEYSLHVAPSKPVVSDDLPPGESQRMWSPTTSTLIRGERDAVLVDPLLTIDESRALADWVVAAGVNITTIFVTHAHADHFFGASAILRASHHVLTMSTVELRQRFSTRVVVLGGHGESPQVGQFVT